MTDEHAVATDAVAAFITIDETDKDGVRRRVEYRARPLGVKDYVDLQQWLRKRVINEALALVRDEKIDDPVLKRSIMDHANERAARINLMLFDNEETAQAFNDFDTWVRFVYYALRREHPALTLDKTYDIVDAAPNVEQLVKDIQGASTPELSEEQKKSSEATTETMMPKIEAGRDSGNST